MTKKSGCKQVVAALALVESAIWALPGRAGGAWAEHHSGNGWAAQGNHVAQGHGSGKHKDRGDDEGRNETEKRGATQQLIFTPRDHEVITGYYRSRASGLPPGLAKRGGNLPPGLERQLQRNGTLPPGLQKKLQPLPLDLDRRLPFLPAGYERRVIGTAVVLLDRKTGAIQDIIRDVATLSGR